MRSLAILVALVFVALGGYWLWNSDGGVEWEALEHESRAEEVAPDAGELAAPEQRVSEEPQSTAEPVGDVEVAATQRTALEAEGWLVVRAIDRRTKEPLSGQGIYLDFGEARVQAIEAFNREEPSTGSVGTGVLANQAGEARFRVPAGRELRAFVVLDDSMPPAFEPPEPIGETHVTIGPLTVGEDRTVQLLVGLPTRAWHLQVVERESGLPVAGATVASEEDWKMLQTLAGLSSGATTEVSVPPRFTLTDHDGLTVVTIPERDHTATSIHAEGYGPVYVPNSTRHETEHEPFLVRLDRSATIRGQLSGIHDPESTVAFVHVQVSKLIQPSSDMYFSGGMETFTARLGPAGEFELSDLPPNVTLEMKFSLPSELFGDLQVDALQLRPGEIYEHIWDLRKLGNVKGHVVDALGAPLRNVTVWLVSGVNPTSYNPQMTPLQVAQSAGDGSFDFGALTEGHYLVGIGKQEQTDYSRRAAALAVPIEVRQGVPVPDVELVVHRGVYVRGRVLLPDGEPAENVHVFVGRAGAPPLNEMTAGNGEFEIGPLLAGEYRLQCYVLFQHERISAPASIVVEAPASGIEIRLLVGGKLEGHIVDSATGEHVPGKTSIQQPFGLHKISMAVQGGHSAFDYDSLAAGTYNLIAEANDGRVGILRGVQLEEGESIDGLEIPVTPAGALRCSYQGSRESVYLRVLQGDVDLQSRNVRQGELLDCRAPVGTAVVEAASGDWSTPPAEREVFARSVVDVIEGEEIEVVLTE
jgi:hypothetical protein